MNKFLKVFLTVLFKPRFFGKAISITNNKSIFYKSKIKSVAGVNNKIIFNSSKIINSFISIGGSNNQIVFGNDSNIHNLNIIIEGNNNRVTIGERTIIGGATDIVCSYGSKVIIGNDCLFSKNIVIRTWDSHKIYNNEIWSNKPQDIEISNNVWFCERSAIFSGGYVPNNSVVAFGGVVTKSFSESNIILGGVPARIIKKGIKWEK